jgi:hypothetical protein
LLLFLKLGARRQNGGGCDENNTHKYSFSFILLSFRKPGARRQNGGRGGCGHDDGGGGVVVGY